MASITCFEDLKIWQEARIFAKDVYSLTTKESFSKEFRLKEQIKVLQGRLRTTLPKALNGTEIKNLYNF